jgi:hypothetical protein
MAEKSKRKMEKPDFRILFPGYSDEKIMEILKKRKFYQPEAAQLAVEEAIKRGIIHSEQDLFDENFKEKPLKTSIFPAIEDEKNSQKIRKSISRMLMVAGVVPVVSGILKIRNEVITEGGIIMAFGMVWIFLSVLIFRKMNKKTGYLLTGMLILSAIYLINGFLHSEKIVATDIFAFTIFYLLYGYGLLFICRMKE